MTAPSTASLLQLLSKPRLFDLARTFEVALPQAATKDEQVASFTRTGSLRFRTLVSQLLRDELKAACRAHNLDDSGRARAELAARLLQAHGATESAPPPQLFNSVERSSYLPTAGTIVQARHRQWLVEAVVSPPRAGDLTLVKLVCLDDDNQGRTLDILWELELGAKVTKPESHGLGDVSRLDPPRHFAAYLHALKWNSVTATDAKLFQSPFRAGIQLFDHQLTPLRKALALPRANLFIADDVGLGKTIEAGLIAQELLLRQRVEFMLIVCPASVSLQWRDEMQKRFGLHFEIMNRTFIMRRREERGFGVNPWSTHTRFIVSHQTLRRPGFRDPILQHIGERARKSLLILDEAHVAAPAAASRYAVDSKITDVIRDIAPRFENRLFLSATPHNGHSNSFSALLEILDPQRFTRGVKVAREQLETVMVRRLKEDLRHLGRGNFPKRVLVPLTVGSADSAELVLARKLAEYASMMKPQRGRHSLVFVNLQKRLLSSVEAFHRTLQAHHRAITSSNHATLASTSVSDDDEYGVEDDVLDQADEVAVELESRSLPNTGKLLVEEMLATARQHRSAADDKVKRLVYWIREHQCRAVAIGGADSKASKADRKWADRRVLIFTEYGDTKRYLRRLLAAAIDGTDAGDERILELHGGMSDEARDEVQRAFNSVDHPVRILIATDAAREGVNLQGHCADLFHFDVPWNPARIEQRNGRIDRTLQPSPEVRCHYFVYPDRAEDIVLKNLIEKVEVIQRDLGSISSVLLERFSNVMDAGIDGATNDKLLAAEEAGNLKATASEELESRNLDTVRADIEEAGELLNRSRKVMDFDPTLLRDAIDVGLELAQAGKLAKKDDAWIVPPLSESWALTLDSLRPSRGRSEPLWEFRKKAPMPVVFEAPKTMNAELAHLHLQHPLVQRVLARFLSQGYSAHDLSRVTVVRTKHDALARVIAFGRLSLFGPGATRLHDQLVSLAARWFAGKEDELKTFAEDADRKAIELLEQVLTESPSLETVSPIVQAKLIEAAPRVFATMWKHIRDEADALAHQAEVKLSTRGIEESTALRKILETQRAAIIDAIEERQQMSLFEDKRDREQFKKDQEYMGDRLVSIQLEVESEPGQIRDGYKVALRRLEPVGLVFLWPETRG